jgi:hypothetical protein
MIGSTNPVDIPVIVVKIRVIMSVKTAVRIVMLKNSFSFLYPTIKAVKIAGNVRIIGAIMELSCGTLNPPKIMRLASMPREIIT